MSWKRSVRGTILARALPAVFLFAWASQGHGRDVPSPATVQSDWPTYRGDIHRSGASPEGLKFPLAESWTHRADHAPRPAWPELPADKDVWHRIQGLGPTTTFDRALHGVLAGDAVYYGSSADDTVYCLDAATGAVRWSFVTEGPVRLAPTVADGKVYVGSDDGCLYCLSADGGRLLWKYRGGPEDRRLPGNERMMSLWPVRCGLVVDQGIIYGCAGLFPSQGSCLWALDAASGREIWKQQINASPQGYLVASTDYLFLPTGRTAPRKYRRNDGKELGMMPGGPPDSRSGGCFAVVIDDLLVYSGGESNSLFVSDARALEKVVFADGLRVVAQGPRMYVLTRDRVVAIDRPHYLELTRLQAKLKKTPEDLKRIEELGGTRKSWLLWETRFTECYEMILAGQTLLVGGLDRVIAISAVDGRTVWAGTVSGKAHGLAVGKGALVVSTDHGTLHCFRSGTPKPPAAAVFDVSPPVNPYPDDALTATYREAAQTALRTAGVQKGYCLVLGAGTGRLAYEIARRSQFQVVGIEPDGEQVALARQLLKKAGLYGTRIAIHQGPLDKLPYQSWWANLIVSDQALARGALPGSGAEAYRVLRPSGGTIVLMTPKGSSVGDAFESWGRQAIPGWKVSTTRSGETLATARRGAPSGAGQWSHFYADPGNTACSGDQMRLGPVEIQWFGRPGPRRMPDRHDKNLGPVYHDGRLFVAGDNYLAAVDAYNGTMLWERDVPDFVRLGAFKHSGGMAAANEMLYAASGGDCLALDAQTGRHRFTCTAPPLADGRPGEWGYVAAVDDLLLGSQCKPGTTLREQTLDTETLIWRDFMPVACSDSLFAHQRRTGDSRWTYTPDQGVIVNPTIAVGGGRVYFVESVNPDTRQLPTGRVTLEALLGRGSNLVALELASGKTLWKKSVDLAALQHIVFLSYAKERLVVTGTKNVVVDGQKRVRYDLAAFDAASGNPHWKTTQKPIPDHLLQGGHGEQVQHSAIVGDIIYNTGFACRLDTGEPIDGWTWKKSGNCGVLSASTYCGFSRYSAPRMFDLVSGKHADLTQVTRPGCWINILPVGGLVLIPEQTAGCTCGYSIQTSLALRPCGESP